MSDNIVYVVTSGAYSDYGISAVFSTREKAEEFIRLRREFGTTNLDGTVFYSDEYTVEEYALDEEPVPKTGAFWARIWDDGTGNITWWGDRDPNAHAFVENQQYAVPGRHRVFNGFGETREHARRSAEELRRATLAGTVVA
jgi:hypothetical protein